MGRHGIALFGMGRAGTIHFCNLIGNHRVNLLYIVDMDMEKVTQTLDDYNQKYVRVLMPQQSNQVYSDNR